MSDNPITAVSRRIAEHRRRGRGRRGVPKDGTEDAPRQQGPRDWRYLRPADLAKFKNLLFAAQTIVEGYYAGRHRSPFKGSAPDFADYRQYYPGDEMRTIDWKAYARTDRYIVKRYEQETDMVCSLLLDASASMAYRGIPQRGKRRRDEPAAEISKYDYGAYLCAALAFLIVKQGDKAGLTLFDAHVRAHHPAAGTIPHLYTLLRALEDSKPGKKTSISEVLQKTHGLAKRKGMLIIVSDLLDDPDEVCRGLNRFLHRGFEIILFHVMHAHELTLPDLAAADFVDAEGGDRITCVPEDLRKSYEEEVTAFREDWAKRARARGIDYHFVTTDTPYAAALEKYLIRRGRG